MLTAYIPPQDRRPSAPTSRADSYSLEHAAVISQARVPSLERRDFRNHRPVHLRPHDIIMCFRLVHPASYLV